MKSIRFFILMLFFVGFSTTASAQFMLGAGPSFNLDAEEVGLNVRAIYGFTDAIRAQAGYTYYFVGDGVSFSEINVNGNYVFAGEPGGTLIYALAGINIFTASVDLGSLGGNVSASETGFNVGAGVNLGLGDKLLLFGEAKYIISDADGLVLTAGVLFPL